MFRLWVRSKVPKWSSLRGLGENRLLRTSYLWLLLVPLFVKLINKLHETGGLVFGAYRIPLDFELPFSWEIFFYSAVFASAANLIYVWTCPRIIKDYPSYLEFKEQGKERDQLRKEFSSLIQYYHNQRGLDEIYRKVNYYLEWYCVPGTSLIYRAGETPEEALLNVKKTVQTERIAKGSEPDVFWFIRDLAERLSTDFRAACWLLYIVALCLAGFVLLQNVWFVVQYTYKGLTGGH